MKGFDNTIDKLMVFASDIDRKRHGSVIAEELHGMRFSSHKGHCDKCGGRDVLVLDVASGNGVFLQDVVVAAGALAGGKFGLNLKDVTGVDNKKRHLLPGGKFRPERPKRSAMLPVTKATASSGIFCADASSVVLRAFATVASVTGKGAFMSSSIFAASSWVVAIFFSHG